MKRAYTFLGVSGLVLALSLPGWAQPQTQTLPTRTVTISGTVETIDHVKHIMNIKTSSGFEAIDFPENVPQLDAIKVGDKVSVTYNNNVSVKLKAPGEADVDTGTKTSTGAGGAMVQRTMTATITAIDKSASSITFTGPNGWKYSRHVVDPAVFDKVKVGDKVDISWNTDVTAKVN